MNQVPQNFSPAPQRSKKRFALISILVLCVVLPIILFLVRVLMNLVLVDASQKGNLHVVSLLLKAGADPNANDEGQTPLLMAVEGQHLDVVRLLVAQGANIEGVGAFGDTPLTACVGNNYAPIVYFLLEHGADINAKNASGNTLLMEAASNANSELVQALLARHADVNLQNAEGETALMQAASVDYPVKAADLATTVQTLIDHGTSINATDDRGQTALTLAQHYKHSNVSKMLEQANRK